MTIAGRRFSIQGKFSGIQHNQPTKESVESLQQSVRLGWSDTKPRAVDFILPQTRYVTTTLVGLLSPTLIVTATHVARTETGADCEGIRCHPTDRVPTSNRCEPHVIREALHSDLSQGANVPEEVCPAEEHEMGAVLFHRCL